MFQRQPWMRRAGEHPHEDKEYFSLLARAVFSAGLGPKVVESRWEGLRSAFQDFDPQILSAWGPEDVDRLLTDAGIIRNRRKIEAVLANALVFLEIVEEHKGFAAYLESCGVAKDFEHAVELLTGRFAHLGRASAAFFLFSAGWRPSDLGGEPAAEPAAEPQPTRVAPKKRAAAAVAG